MDVGEGGVEGGPVSLASPGQCVYRPPILKGPTAAGFPEGCVFPFRAKTGGANRMASENTRKGN